MYTPSTFFIKSAVFYCCNSWVWNRVVSIISYIRLSVASLTDGLMKTVPSVYTLLLNSIYISHVLFLHFFGLPTLSDSPQAVRYEFYLQKKLCTVSSLRFRKSQESSGGNIFRDIAILKLGGGIKVSLRVKIIYFVHIHRLNL